MACHSCSQSVPDGARFCPSCGVAQQPSPEPADEARRVVTVVFADIVGFTTLSEHRDPESVKRLVDGAFEALVRDIESHGGVVDKVLGDGIIALFGAPVAHEDDADRAVRAALAMQQSLSLYSEANPGDDLRMRIGINTGEVLVGTLAGSDYTAMGDVVNTASRVQALADPGAVLVGDSTRELSSAAIRFERYDDVQLRGREQATVIWRALGIEAAAIARRWRSDVPFVGRTSELSVLMALGMSVAAGRGAIAAVTGEAGIGKSRLVQEALSKMLAGRPDALLLEGACAPYGETNVWWPVTGGIIARFGLDRGSRPDEARRRIVRVLTGAGDYEPGTPEFERAIELIMHLLGHPSKLDALNPTGVRDAVVAGLIDAIGRRARQAPVIVWVDDLQWAAPVLLDLLETVARQLADQPVLIVTTSRPDDQLASVWPPAVDPALTLHVSLDALDDATSNELVAAAAQKQLPEKVMNSIAARSGGNPLFLIELARLAATTGSDIEGDLPGTLRALIASRLDRLSPTQRQVLDNAAILGNQGRLKSLTEFAQELGQTIEPGDIAALDALGLLVQEGRRWRFRSDVVREVAYSTLTKQARAQRHAGVAGYLAAREPHLYDRRAHHAASAAELCQELGPIEGVPAGIARDAVDLLIDAAKRWTEQGAHRRCLQLIERALALGTDDEATERHLLLLRVEALVDLHDMRPARQLARELSELADSVGDRVLIGESARLLGTIDQTDGDLIAARAHLSRAVDVFREIGDTERLAEALRARGLAEVFGGSLADAIRFLDEAEELFAQVDDPRGLAWVHQHRAWVAVLSGDHALAERRLASSIDAFEQLNDRAGKAWSMGLLAYVYHFTRRDAEALEVAAEVIADAKRWGDDWGLAMMRNLSAIVHLWRGELEQARVDGERSLEGFRRIDDRFGMMQALTGLTRTNVGLGRSADADRAVEEVLSLAGTFGDMAYPKLAAAGAAMHVGNGERAATLAVDARRRLDSAGVNEDEAKVVAAFGELLAGDPDAAQAQLLDVNVDISPFALAASATIHAVLGDHQAAREAIAMSRSLEGVSYWDRALVDVVAAVVAEGDEAGPAVARLAELVEQLEDVVLAGYAREVLRRLTDDEGVPRREAIGGWAGVAARVAPARSPST